ncbi:MAG: hypothetical protein B7733_03695 [Myxococcales bacterium FL481]|nr:MAG: hypothetical protein B7733_03695 [Myxococcales bacterium FL481]
MLPCLPLSARSLLASIWRIAPFLRWSPAVSLAALGVTCTPPGTSGRCDDDDDCRARGQVCDALTHECVEDSIDYDATQTEPEATFTGKWLPFFRGRICTVDGTFQAGAALPIRMEPCVHPCITASNGDAHVFHLRTCRGATCEGLSTQWFLADGTNCPADAFERFDAERCTYPVAVAGRHPPFEHNGRPIVGRFELEIPFLTNEDAGQIAGFSVDAASEACAEECDRHESPDRCHKACFIRERAEAYAQFDDRVMVFDMQTDGPAPPADCEDNQAACPCVDVGF